MPWYFYSGRVPAPVRTVDGAVVSVPPRGHVEASPFDVRKFGSKMRRCAPPAHAVEAVRPVETIIAKPSSTSPMSESVRERGVTNDPARPPTRPIENVDEDEESDRRRSRSRKKADSVE